MTARRGGIALAVLLAVVSVTPALADGDPYRPQQWNLERIGVPQAWEAARGDGEVIAVVDSGVDLEHPDLVDRFVRTEDGDVLGIDVVDGDDDPSDDLGHGTMVAGIAAASADNGVGIAGVAPDARLLPVRVLDAEGSGSSADVDEGIRWAVDNGATVVNLSLEASGAMLDGSLLTGLTAPVDAVEYAADRGVVVVAAAGNSGNAFTDYPPSSPVVLVGSTTRDDERSSFSDSGRDDLLMAPGVEIVSTWCRAPESTRCDGDTHNYGIADGTSFSAPQVAGAIAVLRSLGVDGERAVQLLRETAVDLEEPGRDDGTGHGRVDLAAAVAAASTDTPDEPSPGPTPAASGDPSPAPSPTPSAPSPTPSGSPTPSDTPTPTTPASPPPTPTTSDGATPAPDVTADPVGEPTAAPPPGPPAGRGPWIVVATLLVAVVATAHARVAQGAQRLKV